MRNRKDIPCIEMRSAVKRFSGIIAVDHVSLKVEKGKVFSLLGPSGCGKTTTLRLVAGLETLDGGDILIDGKVVNDIPPYKRDCSIVFQSLALFPHMSIGQNVAYGLERRKVPRNEIKRRVREMMELMGLYGMERRRPAQLSGGQQQRVALARSLVLKPKILLLDEPLASLDRKLRKGMQVELKRIQREVGITFLYVTHDQKVALGISDIIAVMEKGKIMQVGTPREIYESPRTRFIADFMGANNIFHGKVIATGTGKVELETEDGLRIVAPESKGMVNEKIIGISVHPELMDILPKNTDLKEDNKFKGKVVEMIYQGDFIEMKISLNQNNKLVSAHLANKLNQKTYFSQGEEVVVHWDWRNSNILFG